MSGRRTRRTVRISPTPPPFHMRLRRALFFLSPRHHLVLGTLVTTGLVLRLLLSSPLTNPQKPNPVLASLLAFASNNNNNIITIRNYSPTTNNATTTTTNNALPPLETILDDNDNIIGDVQILLDFAVIGFGKCGTTTMMEWLAQHSELQVLKSEIWALVQQHPARLIRRLHKKLIANNQRRGYKCPGDVHQKHVVAYYRTLWPKTQLLIGIRHPIDWFQSLYNYRIQNNVPMVHPNQLIGGCGRGSQLTCTYKGNFASRLVRLGKQFGLPRNHWTPWEEEILESDVKHFAASDMKYLPNDIFLFTVEQLSNASLHPALQHDVQTFLQLQQPMPPLTAFKPGRVWNESQQATINARKMNICHDDYIPLRKVLLRYGRYSQWIVRVFLDLPGVHVSSRPEVERIIQSYAIDPCGPHTDATSDERAHEIYERTRQDFVAAGVYRDQHGNKAVVNSTSGGADAGVADGDDDEDAAA